MKEILLLSNRENKRFVSNMESMIETSSILSDFIRNTLSLFYLTSKPKPTPWTLCFVYHPEGEILIKGWWTDVKEYIKEKYPLSIVNTEFYGPNYRYMNNKNWWWSPSDFIIVTRPQVEGGYLGIPKQSFSKYRVNIGYSPLITLEFKRMPNMWIPEYDDAIKKAQVV